MGSALGPSCCCGRYISDPRRGNLRPSIRNFRSSDHVPFGATDLVPSVEVRGGRPIVHDRDRLERLNNPRSCSYLFAGCTGAIRSSSAVLWTAQAARAGWTFFIRRACLIFSSPSGLSTERQEGIFFVLGAMIISTWHVLVWCERLWSSSTDTPR